MEMGEDGRKSWFGGKAPGTVGMISAVRFEGSRLIDEMRPVSRPAHSGSPSFFTGRILGMETAFALSGPGKVNAAHAATLLIERYKPRLLINLGIGGAYPSSGISVGDVAVATREIYADEGLLLEDGISGFESIGIPLVRSGRKRWFNEFELDGRGTRSLIGRLIKESRKSREYEVIRGAFATVSACTGTTKKALEIESRFNVVCENMEGAAVAHICAIYGIPMIEIRGISNLVEDRNRESWDVETAAAHCQQTVADALELLKKAGP